MSHYYENDPNLKNLDIEIEYTFKGCELHFKSNSGVFSKNRVDFGTNVLLNSLPDLSNEKSLLDVGCGVGIIGTCIKKKYNNIDVSMIDINERCIELAKKNLEYNGLSGKVLLSDMYEKIDSKFDVIISNPPIRAGKKKVFEVVDGAYEHLNDGGKIFCVIQKKQGEASFLTHMKDIFKNVEIINKEKGYYILKSVK